MSKVKWGVIGAGGIADRRTIPGMMLAKNAELVAVMEVNKELAEKIRAKYNAKRAYDNVDDLLADEEVQAVYIASPVIYHKEQVIKAANAKKHILVEKPVAFSVEDGKELVELCKKNNVLIATRVYDEIPCLSSGNEKAGFRRQARTNRILQSAADLLVS
ncbi:MAG: Gfo/Idh/MocA family protein [Clostridia bacterium]